MDNLNIKERLLKLIDRMPNEQLWDLVKQIEGQGIERRKHPRENCSIPIDCNDQKGFQKSFIKNICAGGVFIETQASVSVGQEITIAFVPESFEGPIKLTGRVVRKETRGVAVKFYEEIPDLLSKV